MQSLSLAQQRCAASGLISQAIPAICWLQQQEPALGSTLDAALVLPANEIFISAAAVLPNAREPLPGIGLRQRPATVPSRRLSAPPISFSRSTRMIDRPLVSVFASLVECPRASSAARKPARS